MEFREYSPPREAVALQDFTLIAAAMIEAAAPITDGASYRSTVSNVREVTGYQSRDVASVLVQLIGQGVLEHAININRRGSALTPLGRTIHQNMRRRTGLDDETYES